MIIVPVERLLAPSQFFRCSPLAAVLRASACLARQKAARADEPGRVAGGRRDLIETAEAAAMVGTCRACAEGARVATRLGASLPPRTLGPRGRLRPRPESPRVGFSSRRPALCRDCGLRPPAGKYSRCEGCQAQRCRDLETARRARLRADRAVRRAKRAGGVR